jgi:hypothetical protein
MSKFDFHYGVGNEHWEWFLMGAESAGAENDSTNLLSLWNYSHHLIYTLFITRRFS